MLLTATCPSLANSVSENNQNVALPKLRFTVCLRILGYHKVKGQPVQNN